MFYGSVPVVWCIIFRILVVGWGDMVKAIRCVFVYKFLTLTSHVKLTVRSQITLERERERENSKFVYRCKQTNSAKTRCHRP
ncbi:hypothetical protein SCLCIDRAFT_878705 [Scleroderma citrinum Foug A]|uniref:Uncharacterized protein n=1 Tax=Scleroderma citrinum Foug A TaxID=1036808 RepID=A0A0C3E0D6_9AGAM|nr:hypothetical protein SCLCIDRAFT_878705 [Scleroderma citrinum Foug A]